MHKRTLSLKREALASLDADEMSSVNGGSHAGCPTHDYTCDACGAPTLPLNPCIDALTDYGCPTISPDMCIWTR